MEIVPVIDLLQGNVVRAQRGERHRYRPIRSTLCNTSHPMDVVNALLELYPFKSLYIADLDAIQGQGSHAKTINRLKNAHPGTDFWVDCGLKSPHDWLFKSPGFRCILGSENLLLLEDYLALQNCLSGYRPILSLDFSTTEFIGHPELQAPARWPETLICMTLGRVGSYEGPDFDRLNELKSTALGSKLYAAGGIRDTEDLMRLKSLGIEGALLASSLHDGRITSAEIAKLTA